MNFEGRLVPYNWVEIVNITKKDGSPLDAGNWRNNLIGMRTVCWIAGGLNNPTPFFMVRAMLYEGKIVEFDPQWKGNASTGTKYPVEVEPGIYDFESNTSVYQFRVLVGDELAELQEALEAYAQLRRMLWESASPGGGGAAVGSVGNGGGPVS